MHSRVAKKRLGKPVGAWASLVVEKSRKRSATVMETME